MSRSSLKAIQSAAGAAGSDPVYVEDVFATHLYMGNQGTQSMDNNIKLADGLTGGTATLFNWNDKIQMDNGYNVESGVSSYTISFYVRCITGENDMRIFGINAYSFFAIWPTGGGDRFIANINRHDGNGNAAALYYTCPGLSDGRWHHILFSVASNGSESCYFDDSAASLYAGDVYSSSAMAGVGSGASYGVDIGGVAANNATTTAGVRGSLAHLYVKGGEYLDLSQSSNRRIFTNSDLTPVATSNLSGRSPHLYFPLADNRTTNLGTMNNTFSEVKTPKPCTGVDEVGTGEGGLVWIRARDASGGSNHRIYDTERGANKSLVPNGTAAEATHTDHLTNFNIDGFTIGASADVNWNNSTYGDKWCSWTFRKQKGFCDIVKYSGTGSAQTISHSLGSAPGMIIVKNIGRASTYWHVYHRAAGGSYSTNPHNVETYLNTTDNEQNGVQTWGTTAPTSTQFTIGGSGLGSNYSGDNYVAYLFAHDQQNFGADSDEAIIKCGSYTRSSSAWSVNLGFEPQFLLIKLADGTGSWQMLDNMRGLGIESAPRLIKADSSNAENNAHDLRINATGFEGNGAGDSGTYIYMAIRRPHKTADLIGLYKVFDQDYGTERSSDAQPIALTNFPVDLTVERKPSASENSFWFDRLRDNKYVLSSAVSQEAAGGLNRWFDWSDGSFSQFSGMDNYLFYNWRRARGFFDITSWVGTGSTRTVTHNLGAVPEMMLVKNRSQGYAWSVYHSGMGATKYATLNSNANPVTNAEAWNDTAPTSSVLTVKDDGRVNLSNDEYIAYLFASVAGISKVGTFTRTSGDTTNVDCGFSNGTRFLIFKRFEGGVGNWTVYDSVRGIVAGNDPYFFLNDTSTQVENTDYIDPLDAGFTVNSAIATGTFLFYAIAK